MPGEYVRDMMFRFGTEQLQGYAVIYAIDQIEFATTELGSPYFRKLFP
jgi:hypothetical protein